MADQTLSERFLAVCDENQIESNLDILEVLWATTETGSFTLNLPGNDKQKNYERLGDKDVLVLSKFLQDIQKLTGLNLSYNNIGDEGAGHLAELLEVKDSALQCLDLSFNNIQASGAESLARSLEVNSSLRSLRLSGNRFGSTGALQLIRNLQVNRTLQELQLADCDLDTQSVIALSTALKNNSALRSVDLSRPLLFSMQEEWAVHFSEMLKVNGSLVELRLRKMGLTDSGMERLMEGLKHNNTLRYLDLSCNRVTRDGARHLAGVLTQSASLEAVDLSANRIEDEGAVYLSEAIAQPGCILTQNNIRAEGLVSLAGAVKTNNTLTDIYIWGNHLEEPVCQAFRELISSGRLRPEQTDVRPYEVDAHVFLAELSHSLRRNFFHINHAQ